MPSTYKYLPPTAEERMALAGEAQRERDRRRRTYRKALEYYKGNHPDSLELLDDAEPDDNVTLNMLKQAADRTVTFLFPELPQFETDRGTAGPTAQEEYLRGFLDANNALFLFHKWVLRGFLAGHTYLRVHPARSWEKYPRISLLDPTTVATYWRADDQSDVVWYEQRYYEGQRVILVDYVPDRENNRWIVYVYATPDPVARETFDIPTPHGATGFGEYTLSHLYSVSNFELREMLVHESIIPPILETAHLPDPDDYYGEGEVDDDNIQLQHAINRLWSLTNKVARENASPVDVVTGADIEEITTGDDVYAIPNPAARVNRLEMRSDMGATTDAAIKLTETLLANVRVVILKGEAKDLQRVTNAAVRTLFLDMIAKNRLLQSSYGGTLKKLAKLVLEMSGESWNRQEFDPSVVFATPLPTDYSEEANIIALAMNGGYMSPNTAAQRMNLVWAEEQAWIEAHREWEHELAQKFPAVENKEPAPSTNPEAVDRSDQSPGEGE